jgi:hypothetical protein
VSTPVVVILGGLFLAVQAGLLWWGQVLVREADRLERSLRERERQGDDP